MAIITVTTEDGAIVESYRTSGDGIIRQQRRYGDAFNVDKDGHWRTLASDLRDDLRKALEREATRNASIKDHERRLAERKCVECGRTFDMLNETDAAEWTYGHDCES